MVNVMTKPKWTEDVPSLVPMNETLARREAQDHIEVAETYAEAQRNDLTYGAMVYPKWKDYEDRGPLPPHCRRRTRYCPHNPACKW